METASCNDLRDLNHGGSFSFSCSESDLNFSSLSHFTDDDDDEDDESYIEIALDHHDHKPTNPDPDEEDDTGGLDHAEYLRISFSSSLLQDLSAHTRPNIEDKMNIVYDGTTEPVIHRQTPSSSSVSCPLSSSSMEGSRSGPLEGSYDSSRVCRSTSKRGRLRAVNRLVNTLLFGLRSSSELPVHADNADLERSRKTSINGGIMKFLFKFRAMNFGTLVSSLVKPRQVACDDHDDHDRQPQIDGQRKNKKSKARALKPLDKWMVKKKQGKCNNSSEVVGVEKYSRVLEINLGAVRGVLEAIGNSMSTGISRKERRTRSCPSSIKSSPLHQGFTSSDQQSKVCVYARETSIQAAIAHCKTSFEQTSMS